MTKFNFVLLALLLGLATATTVLKHECHHDKISDYIKQEVKTIDIEEHERHMASTTPRKMVITYDSTFLNTLPASTTNTAFKTNVIKAINIALQFISDLITIVPRTPYMKWDLTTTTCGAYTVPASDKVLGRDSDLHLYITYTNEPTKSFLAYAGWCRLIQKVGATHGQVNFNLGLLSAYKFDDNFQFQDLLEIVIHEITHVLGFSGNDIKYWVDASKNAYTAPTSSTTIRGLSTTLLKTPNVLAQARAHYGCTTLAGMPLENQGETGSLGSHWETTAINGELMNAAISSTQGSYSKFTTALLRDTGYYTTVNTALEEPVQHGKNGGCSFVTGECTPATQKDFCVKGAAQICDPNGYAVSVCTTTSFTDTNCFVTQPYSNGKCYDGSNNYQNVASYVSLLGVAFGNNSRCFMSNVTSSASTSLTQQGLCYNYTCNSAGSQITVKVAGKDFVCTTNGQVITGVAGTYGTFNCPPNIAKFCGAKGFCPNQCSTKGFCVNGACRCLTGYKGTDCNTAA